MPLKSWKVGRESLPAGEVGCVNRVRLSAEEAQEVFLQHLQRSLQGEQSE